MSINQSDSAASHVPTSPSQVHLAADTIDLVSSECAASRRSAPYANPPPWPNRLYHQLRVQDCWTPQWRDRADTVLRNCFWCCHKAKIFGLLGLFEERSSSQSWRLCESENTKEKNTNCEIKYKTRVCLATIPLDGWHLDVPISCGSTGASNASGGTFKFSPHFAFLGFLSGPGKSSGSDCLGAEPHWFAWIQSSNATRCRSPNFSAMAMRRSSRCNCLK